jgi:uncharacterized protein
MNPMLLKPKHKEILLNILKKTEIPIEVWAFGSRVNGTAHDASDLDLVIRTSNLERIPLSILSKIKEDLYESKIPYLVDLFDWARLPESFHRNILKNYEPIYSSQIEDEKLIEYSEEDSGL